MTSSNKGSNGAGEASAVVRGPDEERSHALTSGSTAELEGGPGRAKVRGVNDHASGVVEGRS